MTPTLPPEAEELEAAGWERVTDHGRFIPFKFNGAAPLTRPAPGAKEAKSMAQENPNDPDLTAARDELGLVRLHLTLAAVAAESAEALLLRTIRESPEAEETVEVRS